MKDNVAKQEEQNKLIETKKKQLKEVEDELNSLKQKIMTKNREYEFDESRYRLMVYETNLLKQFLVCSLGLFVFVVLKQSGVLPKIVCMVLYGITLMGIIGYFLYKYKENRKEKDLIDSNEIEFDSPKK